MKQFCTICGLILGLFVVTAGSAQAACFVEYKAKKDDPLRLHYGILQLNSASCPSKSDAAAQAASRLSKGGWTFLNVVGMSKDTPSAGKKANAGSNYLKY